MTKQRGQQLPVHHHPPANTSRYTLHTVLDGTLFSEASSIYTQYSLQDIVLTFLPPGDIEEMVNGVVNPVTNETTTKYAKIIEVP